jgi:hypothetical protein
MTNVPDLEGHQIAATKLAVDAQVEQREFADAAFHLQPDAQGPDVLELERRLLPNDLSLVPRFAV